jgi:CRISPR-associated protein Csx10
MTESLAVTVTARQAIALGRRPTAEATVQTYLHIPGSVLRGALAGAWLAEHGDPDPVRRGRAIIPCQRRAEFTELFESGVRFGPLLSPGSYIAPMSVRRCKYPSTPGCKEVAIDEAFTDAPPGRCPECGGVLEAGRGDVEGAEDLLMDDTRVALTEGETAEEGLLYTRRSLRARDAVDLPVTFTGRLTAARGTVPEWLTLPRRLQLGGRRGTGGAGDYAPGPVASANGQGGTSGTGRIVLRLLSPALLVDRYGRPALRPDEELVAELLGVRARNGRAWTRTAVVGGWHAASNLPKPEEMAVSAGSVFELLLPDGDAPAEGVAALLAHGLGVRRAEGYGWAEQATAPWRRPQPRAENKAAPPSGMVVDMAATFYDSGHGRWLLKELRRFLDAFEGDRRPPPYLLQRPQLERPLHDKVFRRRLELLLTRVQPEQIQQVIDALEARIRGAAP